MPKILSLPSFHISFTLLSLHFFLLSLYGLWGWKVNNTPFVYGFHWKAGSAYGYYRRRFWVCLAFTKIDTTFHNFCFSRSFLLQIDYLSCLPSM